LLCCEEILKFLSLRQRGWDAVDESTPSASGSIGIELCRFDASGWKKVDNNMDMVIYKRVFEKLIL